jgi:hypothetical protein
MPEYYAAPGSVKIQFNKVSVFRRPTPQASLNLPRGRTHAKPQSRQDEEQ